MSTREKRLGQANKEGSPWTRSKRPPREERLASPKMKRSLGVLQKLQGYIATRSRGFATVRDCMIRFSWDQQYTVGMVSILMKADIVTAGPSDKPPVRAVDLEQATPLYADPHRLLITREEAELGEGEK